MRRKITVRLYRNDQGERGFSVTSVNEKTDFVNVPSRGWETGKIDLKNHNETVQALLIKSLHGGTVSQKTATITAIEHNGSLMYRVDMGRESVVQLQ